MSDVKTCKDVESKGSSQTKKDPPPMNRVKEEATINPCSGRYEGGGNGVSVQLMVDVDKLREYSTKLDAVSGTVSVKNAGDGPWSGDAVSIYFTVLGGRLKYSGEGTDSREITAHLKATFSDGEKAGGDLCVQLSNNRGWKADVDIEIDDQPKLSFKSLERTSMFFKDVNIDIDYTEKVTWPIVELYNLISQPAGMERRKIDAFSAFEDAGLKLHFDQEKNSELVSDPSEGTPWTKSDLYEIMRNYFDETDGSDDNIWCMMGTTPPDKRYMGFSFDRKGKHGFALFTGHTSFIGMDSDKPSVKAVAQRRLLHYFIHECGHCLGLKHPFEIGVEDSLSWMNYAWKYDSDHEPGSFYDNFKYTFSDQELMILRHSPGKAFTAACSSSVLVSILGNGYRITSDVPDLKLADDDSDDDDEDTVGGETGSYASKRPKYSKPRPMRKIVLDLRIQTEPFVKGQLFSFEARIKNVGKLPALIEGDLSLESGNLQLYLTDPDGTVQVIDPFVRPIQSGFSRPLVLYTPEDEEGPDRYSELVIVGEGSQGYQFNVSGKYELRAVYTGGRYKVTSATYPVTIVDDDEDDEETRNEILEAATLQTSSWSRFKKAKEFWEKITSKTVEHKKKHVTALMCVMEGLCKESTRQPATTSKRTRSGKRKVKLSAGKSILTPEKLLQDTADILAHYQKEGQIKDNQVYSKLVLTRCKLALLAGKIQEADNEFNKMLADLVTRRVKYEVLQRLSKTWNRMKTPVNPEEKMTPQYLQKKVDAVLTWAPSTDGNGEPDLSGIGIGNPFSNFDLEQIQMAVKIVEMLFTKHDETNNLHAVISYADKLQKGREVNYMVLRWALEAFIVHCMAAKMAGIKYPEPEEKDQSVLSDAAMVVTQRTGEPTENWMNYWRSDADLNYHHRHFHIVYVVGNFLRRDASGNRVIAASAPSHLRKQGEMFGYMHTQALARYDADRESWGLQPVQAWTYQERAMSFNAGFEFHNDRQFRSYVPRPNTVWPRGRIRQFMGWQSAYENALQTGVVAPGVELTPNWAGHVLEASSQIYGATFGSIHNAGHGVFGSTGVQRGGTSYMNDTATAMRDIIFYRWHKKIDNMWQSNNDYYRVELAHDGPPVTITADDIIIGSNPQAPAGFNEFKGGEWASKAPAETSTLKTYLGPPMKKFEWDNKISHDRFYYHLRVKRNPDAQGTINLTARIFICPKSRQSERKRWIEMDKFVFRIGANEDHINLTRGDRHSSVIKRLPQDMRDDFEQNFVQASGGFCECGWPYTMLLPRGKKEGEEYVVLVMLTNNNIDQIGLRTTCGSLSYCGARGEEYPDSRNMGYPFSNPITMRGRPSRIPEVFDEINNAAYKSFIIQNNVSEPPPNPARDIWYPHQQLGVDDGSSRRSFQTGVTEFVQSDIVGFFRVLVDNNAASPSEGSTLFLRFQGRGEGGGSYTIRDITLGLRFRNTINVVSRTASVTYKGASEFSVPEEGLISDAVNLRFRPALGDYFVTFALESPGVHLPASQRSRTSTYFIRRRPGSRDPVPSNWSSQRIDGRFAHIHCVSAIMTATSA